MKAMNATDAGAIVESAVRRARTAQRKAQTWSQERLDDVVAAVGWQCYEDTTSLRMARHSRDETGLGDVAHLHELNRVRVLGVLRDLDGQRTTGVISDSPQSGIRTIAKPVGVVAVLTPATAPVPGIACNVLAMLKTANAAIITANPRARGVAAELVALIRATLRDVGAPQDLVQCIAATDRRTAQVLMSTCDLVVAVGGAGTVRRAYASGTPAIGAGVGNATIVVDETADLSAAARQIAEGAGYNNGTSCSSESNVLVQRTVAATFSTELQRAGGHLCSADETQRVRELVWPDGVNLNRDAVGRDVNQLAAASGISPGPGVRTLVLQCDAPGLPDAILTEKLSPLLTMATYDTFAEAMTLVREITDACGRGHSCGIYSADEQRVARFAAAMDAARVLVNHSTMTNAGNFASGVPFTSVLGSGTWGGCNISGNMTWHHLVNTTTVSRRIAENRPDERVIFGRHWGQGPARPDTGPGAVTAPDLAALSPRPVPGRV